MFCVKVDRHEPTELHVQVAAEVRRAIADGEAWPGEISCSSPATTVTGPMTSCE
jgi:hypothetical protein